MNQTEQSNVPQIRFPEFSSPWEVKKIGDFITEHREKSSKNNQHKVLTSSRGGLQLQSEYFGENRITERDNTGFNVIPPEYITYRSRSDNREFFFNENKLGIHGIISIYYPVFRISKGSNKFFTELLNSKRHYVGRYSVGTSQTVLSLNDLRSIRFPIPCETEQCKIARFLEVVDTKIAQLAEKKQLLEDYKKGCMQQIFSQQIRFKDKTGQHFPEWKEKRLGEVFSWVNTNSLSRERLTYDGGQVQNIHYGDIHTKFAANFHQEAEPVPYIRDATSADFKPEQFCKIGDVVIADASEDYADIGKAVEIVSVSGTPLVAGLHTYIARPKPGKVQTGFAGYLLRSAPMRRQIVRIAQGISVLGISKGNLEKLTFFLPHTEEQRKIASFLSALDSKISLVEQELTRLQTFKKGLLQQMFV